MDWRSYFGDKLNKGSFARMVQERYTYNLPEINFINSKLSPNSNILEIGCGSGLDSILLEGYGHNTFCIDIDSKMLKFARENANRMAADVKFFKSNAFQLPFREKSMDLVFSGGVLEHFQKHDAISLIKEQSRVGKLVFASVPTKYTDKSFLKIDDEKSPDWEPGSEKNMVFYNTKTFSNLFRAAGMRVIETFAVGEVNHNLSVFLPPILDKWIRNTFSFAGSICILASEKN